MKNELQSHHCIFRQDVRPALVMLWWKGVVRSSGFYSSKKYVYVPELCESDVWLRLFKGERLDDETMYIQLIAEMNTDAC